MMRGLLLSMGLLMLVHAAIADDLLLDPARDARVWGTYLGWEFPGARGTSATVQDPEQGPCVEGSFDFASDSRYSGIIWYGNVASAQKIGFMVKLLDRDGGFARLRDSNAQEVVAGFSAPHGKWTRVVIDLSQTFAQHWGGTNDGKIHFPLTAVFVGVSRGPDHGQLRVSNLFATVDKVTPADRWLISIDPAGASGVVFVNSQSELREEKTSACKVHVLNRLATDTCGALEVSARNPDGKTLSFKPSMTALKGWQEWIAPVDIPSDRAGYWRLTAHFTDAASGDQSAEAVSGLVVVPRARHYGEAAPDCYFGLQSIPDMEVADRLGCKAVRIGSGWRWSELEKGKFPFDITSDPGINDALKHHMEILFLLQSDVPDWAAWKAEGKPLLASLPDPAKMDLWREWCRRVAEHYKGKIAAYEIQNEPDLTCSWQPGLPQAEGVDYYSKLLQAGYEGIKAGDPTGKVAGIDVSGGDFDGKLPFTAATLDKAGQYLDLYTAHPYSGVRYFGPDQHPIWPLQNTMNERCEAALDLLERHGKSRHMWIGELGWGLLNTSDPLGQYSMDFAACMAQALIVGKSVPGVDKFLWFTEIGCDEGGYEYGVLRGTPAYPLPAALAYSTAAWVLDDTKPVSMKRVAGELWRASFACQKRHEMVVVWWSEGDDVMIRPGAGAPSGTWWTSMYDHPSADHGRYKIGRLPVYWVVPLPASGREPGFLSQISAEAGNPIGIDHLYVAQVSPAQVRLGLLLTNRTSVAQRVTIEVGGKSQAISLAAGAKAAKSEVSFPITLPLGQAQDLDVAITAGGVRQESKLRVNLTALPPPPGAFTADGDVAEWSGMPGFDLHERSDVLPADPGVGWKGPDDLSVKAYLAADSWGLYFAAAVTDDFHFAPSDDPTNFWDSDSIQLALDPTGDTPGQFDADDREIGLVLGAAGPRAFLTYPAPMKVLDLAKASGMLAINRVGKQTVYEAFVPWSAIGVAPPKPGQVMAINFIVNDNDGHGRAFWMGLTPGIGEGKNVGAFRRFVFGAK